MTNFIASSELFFVSIERTGRTVCISSVSPVTAGEVSEDSGFFGAEQPESMSNANDIARNLLIFFIFFIIGAVHISVNLCLC